MIPNDGSLIIIDDIKQRLIYYLLPKNPGDELIIDLPEVIHKDIDLWIQNGKSDLFLDTLNKKYTFRDAAVKKQVIGVNRYGVNSRTLTIEFCVMINGFHRRK